MQGQIKSGLCTRSLRLAKRTDEDASWRDTRPKWGALPSVEICVRRAREFRRLARGLMLPWVRPLQTRVAHSAKDKPCEIDPSEFNGGGLRHLRIWNGFSRVLVHPKSSGSNNGRQPFDSECDSILFQSEFTVNGGTSLSKVFDLMDRFSKTSICRYRRSFSISLKRGNAGIRRTSRGQGGSGLRDSCATPD